MTIYEKIAKIQDEVEVRKEADNPFFHSKYATYEGVLNAIHSAMRKYGLVSFHTFEPSGRDGSIVVVTTLSSIDESSPSIFSKLEIPLLKNDPQSAGSAITYAKRYSLLAILGLGTEDDDGNSSSGKTQTKPINGAGTDGLQNRCICGRMMVERTVYPKSGPNAGKATTILACPLATKENQSLHSDPVWL